MVLGEVVPKNLAIEKADRLAILVAPALLVFDRDARAVHLLRRTIGRGRFRTGSACAAGHSGGGHSAEELKFIVSSSRREGPSASLRGRRHSGAARAVRTTTRAKSWCRATPSFRSRWMPAWIRCCGACARHEYSRLPVYQGEPEHIIGYVHYKDMMRIWEERRIAHAKRSGCCRRFIFRACCASRWWCRRPSR